MAECLIPGILYSLLNFNLTVQLIRHHRPATSFCLLTRPHLKVIGYRPTPLFTRFDVQNKHAIVFCSSIVIQLWLFNWNHAVTKKLIGFARMDSMTGLLCELNLPNFETIIHNCKYVFHYQSVSAPNHIVRHFISIGIDIWRSILYRYTNMLSDLCLPTFMELLDKCRLSFCNQWQQVLTLLWNTWLMFW